MEKSSKLGREQRLLGKKGFFLPIRKCLYLDLLPPDQTALDFSSTLQANASYSVQLIHSFGPHWIFSRVDEWLLQCCQTLYVSQDETHSSGSSVHLTPLQTHVEQNLSWACVILTSSQLVIRFARRVMLRALRRRDAPLQNLSTELPSLTAAATLLVVYLSPVAELKRFYGLRFIFLVSGGYWHYK